MALYLVTNYLNTETYVEAEDIGSALEFVRSRCAERARKEILSLPEEEVEDDTPEQVEQAIEQYTEELMPRSIQFIVGTVHRA